VPITPPPLKLDEVVVCGGDIPILPIPVPGLKLLLMGRGGGGECLVGLRPETGVSWG
jgi:hypothetical protein